jgi:hypothetical protein
MKGLIKHMTNVEYLRNNFPLLKNKSDNSIIMMIDRIGYSVCPTFRRPLSCHECSSCYDMFLEREVDDNNYINNLGNKLENYIMQHEYN